MFAEVMYYFGIRTVDKNRYKLEVSDFKDEIAEVVALRHTSHESQFQSIEHILDGWFMKNSSVYDKRLNFLGKNIGKKEDESEDIPREKHIFSRHNIAKYKESKLKPMIKATK